MRRSLLSLCIVLSALAPVYANPSREEKDAGPPLGRREAQNYATQLAELTQFIAEQYVREVPRAELATAALKGLYEAAGMPVPAGLPAEVRKATSEYEFRKLFANARQRVGNPPPLRGSGAILVSLQAMTARLDPYSTAVTSAEAQSTNPRDPIQGFGLELLDTSGAGPLVIKTVLAGGPAQKAGLRPGDEITRINEQEANTGSATPLALSRFDAVQLQIARPAVTMSGLHQPEAPARPSLALRAGAADSRTVMKVSLKAEAFYPETILGVIRKPDNSWDFMLDRGNKIAQIRIAALNQGVAEELAKALLQLREGGMRGLLLDLRWCPGGFLDDSRDVADLFLGEYNLTHFMQPTPCSLLGAADLFLDHHVRNARVQSRGDEPDRRIQHVVGSFTNFPVVVLVNGETTGGAELVAAVLQDNRRALVAGERTRGKASVQRKYSLAGEVAGLSLTVPVPNMELKLTTGILARPSGKNLNRFADSKPTDDWGVRPEPRLAFLVSAELTQRLQQWWQLQSLRPGSDNGALPLDDPAADPQRQAALQTLLDMLK
jgi:carboxyl-terminal processing protease